ncbi:hypothetical protein J3R83DRAFT_13091 [Lanmaoa asiatica]|nr:hypothetical protein J3R83DRAFT_13091 [Lanmaoa asiatica]
MLTNLWLQFLYRDGKYDQLDPAKRLFKGEIILKAFKLIFTSPSSADKEDTNGPTKRCRGERRTRANVAHLLKMKQVTPRAIAYIAVQARFALSSCGSWRLVDELFDHLGFYNTVINWFEVTENAEEKAFVDDLWWWWNRKVFGREAVINYASPSLDKALGGSDVQEATHQRHTCNDCRLV